MPDAMQAVNQAKMARATDRAGSSVRTGLTPEGHPFAHLLNGKVQRLEQAPLAGRHRSTDAPSTVFRRGKTLQEYFREAMPARATTPPAVLAKSAMSAPAAPVPVSRHTKATSEEDRRIQLAIQNAATQYNVSPRLIHSIARAESAYNPRAVSRAGAKGVMQLIDGTARDMGVTNVFDIEQNIRGGTRYIRQMLDRYHNNIQLALAAYNAGPQAVDRYGGIPPYPETQTYVRRIMHFLAAGAEG